MATAQHGDTVKIHYTGTLDDGTVFDSSEGRAPLEFTIGSGQVIPGFEEGVLGMKVAESKSVNIPPEKAYGVRNEELVMSVPTSEVPTDLNPAVGQKLQMGAPDGQLVVVEVIEVTDEFIHLDANPPLAGKALNFDIELVEIA
jgi:peptidylprolyl isomerase